MKRLFHYLPLLTIALPTFACGGGPQQTPPESGATAASANSTEVLPSAYRIADILPPWAIEDVQQALKSRGYKLDVSARYDRETEDAVRAFQREQELAATGMPDAATLRKLELDPLAIYEDTLAQ